MPPAQACYAICLECGRGVPANPTEAVQWYTRAARQGDTQAQFALAVCCEQGTGTPQSWGDAIRWYSMAAAQELPQALLNLGLCYERGAGVRRNPEEAPAPVPPRSPAWPARRREPHRCPV